MHLVSSGEEGAISGLWDKEASWAGQLVVTRSFLLVPPVTLVYLVVERKSQAWREKGMLTWSFIVNSVLIIVNRIHPSH